MKLLKKLAAFAVMVERFVSRKRKKRFNEKLAYIIWEYENETVPRIDRLEKMLKEKGIINIYSLKDLNG